MQAITELQEYLAEVKALSEAEALLEWDQQTYMPPGGAGARADQIDRIEPGHPSETHRATNRRTAGKV